MTVNRYVVAVSGPDTAEGSLVNCEGEPGAERLASGEWVLTDGRAAATLRAKMAAMFPSHVYRVQRYVPADAVPWAQREAFRLLNGEYKPLPWVYESWFYQDNFDSRRFAHLSQSEPGMVAYTADEAKGAADLQTRMAAGRFLARFYGEVLSEADIERWANAAAAGGDAVNFATSRDDIATVYVNGPSSCMAHSADAFDTDGTHPCEVYAAGDLAVAYLGTIDDAKARCLVWPDKMQMANSCYGNYDAQNELRNALAALGYSRGSLYGAKLLRLTNDSDELILPYIDGSNCAGDDGAFLRLGWDGYNAANTNGLAEQGEYCHGCDERHSQDDMRYIESIGEERCDGCTSAHFTYCDFTHEYYPDEDVVSVTNRRGYTSNCAVAHLSDYDFVELADGDFVSDELAAACYDTDEYYRYDDLSVSPFDGEYRSDAAHMAHMKDEMAEAVPAFINALVDYLQPIVARRRVASRRRMGLRLAA